MINNSSNLGKYRNQINSLENNLSNVNTTISNELVPIKNRLNTVETEITPITRGGTGAINKETAIANLTKPIVNGNWQNAQAGISLFKYEAANTTTYNLSNQHCFVLVIKESYSRGTAVAYTWVNGIQRSYRNNLHDDTGTNTWGTWQNENTVVNTYKSGDSWYRVYSDGWIEQGGSFSCSTNITATTTQVTFVKAFTSSVNIIGGFVKSKNSATYGQLYFQNGNTTLTGMVCSVICYNSGGLVQHSISGGTGYWYACGY